jgi:hypothetical protein
MFWVCVKVWNGNEWYRIRSNNGFLWTSCIFRFYQEQEMFLPPDVIDFFKTSHCIKRLKPRGTTCIHDYELQVLPKTYIDIWLTTLCSDVCGANSLAITSLSAINEHQHHWGVIMSVHGKVQLFHFRMPKVQVQHEPIYKSPASFTG